VPAPQEYRAYAAECLSAMQLATGEDVRATLLLVAQRWTELADRLGAMESATQFEPRAAAAIASGAPATS
jgi:hypothetical protein